MQELNMWLTNTWFLEIDSVHNKINVCMCVYVCARAHVCVSTLPAPLWWTW